MPHVCCRLLQFAARLLMAAVRAVGGGQTLRLSPRRACLHGVQAILDALPGARLVSFEFLPPEALPDNNEDAGTKKNKWVVAE